MVWVSQLLFPLIWGPAWAVEGMWLPEQMPALRDDLKASGLELDADVLANPLTPPLRSIVSLGFCSASFISPDGLIATNHHCVEGYLQVNSSAEANRARDGYLAPDRAAELSAGPGAEVTIVENIVDVTAEVSKGVKPKTKDLDRVAIQRRNSAALVDACEKKGSDRQCRVAQYDGGATFRLIESRVIKDVRLVYAPPNSVGNYGDDIDNWMWPRHSGDFSLLRAYVAPDGSSAPYSADNVPYRPDAHLTIDTTGAQDGEFVMVAGFPGTTTRYQTAATARFWRDTGYPLKVSLYTDILDLLRAESDRDPEAAARLQASIAQLSNGWKKSKAYMDGFRNSDTLERMEKRDAALAAWVQADKKRAKLYGPALAEMDRLDQEAQRTWKADYLVDWLLYSSDLLVDIHRAYRLADERRTADADRTPGYRERDVERLKARSQRIDRELWLPADRALFARVIREVVTLEGNESAPEVDAWLAAHGGLDNAIDALFQAPVWVDAEARSKLYDQGYAEFLQSDDPWVTLAVAIDAQLARTRARNKLAEGARLRLAPQRMSAIRAMSTEAVYPDANGTLRITYGHVMGAEPRDGVRYTPHTRVAGMVAKAGPPPFDAPAALLAAAADAPQSRWADATLHDVPVNFLTDLDTTGGNSGSATLNGKGELVGLIFDGTYESVAADWAVDPTQNRSIHVDIRYLLWMLESVEKADHLLEELGIEPREEAPAQP